MSLTTSLPDLRLEVSITQVYKDFDNHTYSVEIIIPPLEKYSIPREDL